MAKSLSLQFKEKIERKIKNAYKKTISPTEMRKMGGDLADRIRVRTRLGKGVEGDGAPEKPLKPLATSTKLQRKKAKSGKYKLPDLSPKTAPSKSGLTWTGQLLDAIKVIRSALGEVVVGFDENRDDGLSNSRLANIHQNEGTRYKKVKRPFFYISAKDRKIIFDSIRRKLKNMIR